MAAFDTPWTTSMSDAAHPDGSATGEPPTYAAFSPTSSIAAIPSQRSTVIIHQKSPLLLATPPQVTRALAYSHSFILPLNKLFGLLSWTTDDPWESFLLIAAFWAITLYGDVILRWTGPLLVATGLILGMYTRRFSPLSTTFTTPTSSSTTSHTRNKSSVDSITNGTSDGKHARHHKSLDEILASLTTLTHRCNILFAPFLQLTDFLSTQRTATSSTTSPALTALFVRLLALTPVWFALTLPPLRIVTTKRVVLTLGTLVLTWHSRPAKVSRVILWRSRSIRSLCGYITGLSFSGASTSSLASALKSSSSVQDKNTRLARSASSKALNTLYKKNGKSRQGIGTGEGIRFAFTLFENQRRWLGIGWTNSMLAYERGSWTDDELNTTSGKDEFKLPHVDGGVAIWRWAKGSSWRVEIDEQGGTISPPGEHDSDESHHIEREKDKDKTRGASKESAKTLEQAWVYTDTKWRYPRRGQDGWGKYTRRRKWVREAELVDVELGSMPDPVELEGSQPPTLPPRPALHARGKSTAKLNAGAGVNDKTTPSSTPSKDKNRLRVDEGELSTPGTGTSTPTIGSPPKRGWFARKPTQTNVSQDASSGSDKDKDSSVLSVSAEREDADEDNGYIPLHLRGRQGTLEADWGVGEDIGLNLG